MYTPKVYHIFFYATLRLPRPQLAAAAPYYAIMPTALSENLGAYAAPNQLVVPSVTKAQTPQMSWFLNFIEHVVGAPATIRVYNSVPACFNNANIIDALVLRKLFSFWLSGATGPEWWGVGAMAILALKWQDANIALSWFLYNLQSINMRRHRTSILAVFTLFKLAFRLQARNLGIVGISIKVSGKISVTGNSRKRRLRLKLGIAGVHNLTTRASTAFGLVRTNTGCLGIKFGIFYRSLMLHPTMLASILRPLTAWTFQQPAVMNSPHILVTSSRTVPLVSMLLRYSYFFFGTMLSDHSATDSPVCLSTKCSFMPTPWYIFTTPYAPALSRLFIFAPQYGSNIPSIENLFRNARWLERETGEMYNLFYENKKDRRALFTIPLFYKAPLRKKYPTAGLYEIFFTPDTGLLGWRPLSLLN